MKQLNLIILFFVASMSANAQINFKQILPPAPAPQISPVFDEVDLSSIAYADVDGINGLDVLLTGSNSSDQPIAKLYLNDGTGNYTEKSGTPFVGVIESSVAFADVDGNGSQDVLITGFDGTLPSAKLYLNDGNGNFTEESPSQFIGVRESAIAFAEVDNVAGLDVLITGRNEDDNLIAELYLNDGSGIFTSEPVTFGGINKGAVAFADVNGDDALDVVISGFFVPEFSPGAQPSPSTKIYLNDGNANFPDDSVRNFEGLRDSDVAFADVNLDNHQDLLISGFNGSGSPITKLYTNDGSANFTEDTEFSADAVGFSSFAFADVDGTNGPDLLLTGSVNNGNSPVGKLYINDGSGNTTFTLASETPFVSVSRGDIAFLDLNGDATQDLVITGRDNANNSITEIYVNDGTGEFQLATGTAFERVSKGATAFADVDLDGDADIIVTGDNNVGEEIAKLYLNGGNGDFTEVSGTPFTGVETSAVAFADVDGANGPDVLISGFSGLYTTTLYTNDGNGAFTQVSGTPFEGVSNGSIAFADVDGANGQDVVITGSSPSTGPFGFAPITILYTRNSSGDFVEVSGTPFEGVVNSSIVFADMNGNGSQDLIISGEDGSGNGFTGLYLNDNGNFSLSTETFQAVRNSAIAVGDMDGNGSLDLLVTGTDDANNPIVKLYANTITGGNPTFSEVTGTPFEAVDNSAVGIAEIDGVNGNDIIISGENSLGEYITKLYVNDGNGAFEEVQDLPFDGVFDGNISLADVDDDGLIDVLITGTNDLGINISQLFRNRTDFVPPTITSAPTASVDENSTSSFYTATANESEVTFSLGSSKDESFFLINGTELSFLNAADFENPLDADGNNEYLVDLIVTDKGGNQASLEITISVKNIDEIAPIITSADSVSVEENTSGIAYAASANEPVTFTLGSTKDEALFTLATDALSFNSIPDFEVPMDADSDNTYELDLIATDTAGNISTKAIIIKVTDVDETGPTITSGATTTVEENVTGTVYTATSNESVTFSLGTDKDEALFTLATDAISFNSIPDFEAPLDANADNVYELDLIATDTNGNATTKAISIRVTNVEETGPAITSPPTVTVEENITGTVYTATADVNATFSLGTDKDEALFTLANDAISFNSIPDFEAPLDANADNEYELDLTATDTDGNATTKAISIRVANVEETGPAITSPPTATVEENITGTVYTATADVNVTFSLGTSKDEASFSLSSNNLSFNNPPDFESPLDANSDNVYEVDLIATDGDGLSTTKLIKITVENIEEEGEPLATVDEILAKMYPNPAQNSLFIQPKNLSIGTKIFLTDISGGLQKTITYMGGEQEIDVSDLSPGVYLIGINSNGKQIQVKFIKE